MKHLHMTLAAISIILLTYRFALTLMSSTKLDKKWLKISPHVVDTFLLLLGVGLAVKLAINPLDNLWLVEKIIAIIFYIFTGYYALKIARNRAMQVIGYLGAMGWIMLVVRIAMTKQTVFL